MKKYEPEIASDSWRAADQSDPSDRPEVNDAVDEPTPVPPTPVPPTPTPAIATSVSPTEELDDLPESDVPIVDKWSAPWYVARDVVSFVRNYNESEEERFQRIARRNSLDVEQQSQRWRQ